MTYCLLDLTLLSEAFTSKLEMNSLCSMFATDETEKTYKLTRTENVKLINMIVDPLFVSLSTKVQAADEGYY